MAGFALPARSQQADVHPDRLPRERQVPGELANSRGRPEADILRRVTVVSSIAEVLSGYARDAPALIERYDSISSAEKLLPVADLFPDAPSKIADIGAGTGGDAAWFAARGHHVLAIEPVQALREAAVERHSSPHIEWLDDRLPTLAVTRARAASFDLVLSSAVWAHLPEAAQDEALANIASLLKPGARFIMSVRNGPAAQNRPTYAVPVERILEIATTRSLRPIRRVETTSMQARNWAAGVTWDWLAFERGGNS